jgi:hydroxymethylbilane synthase
LIIKNIRIATRQSRLALWQSEYVADTLRRAHPGVDVEIIPMSTRGDEVLDKSLAKIGGKGLFIKELETAMLEGKADVAVHSMKDVPWDMPDGMCIGAALQRADAVDVLVANGEEIRDLETLPEGARVGTSSLRRQSQLMNLRPDLRVLPIRGNVETRLRKLDEGDFDAIVLAAAGLKRLGLGERITARLETDQCLPAVGQGIIGIECCTDNEKIREVLLAVEHAGTRRCLEAERGFAAGLNASCESPVAAHAEIRDDELLLNGLVARPDGSEVLRGSMRGRLSDGQLLGKGLAADMVKKGAAKLLSE